MIKKFCRPCFFLFIIISLAFYLRLYKIDSPIADWHSWRQADTAAVSRNFYKEGFNPLEPKYDDMSGVAEHPIPNPERYRYVEFPIYNSLVYFAYLINRGVDEKLARLVSVLFSLGSITFFYFIIKKFWDEVSAIFATAVFAFLPFNIYFSRVVLPEPSLLFLSLGMFYFTYRYLLDNGKELFFLSCFFTGLAILTKPFSIIYLLPLLYVLISKENRIWPIKKITIIWLAISILPFILWRLWMLQHPEGIPASNWLLNGNGIRLKPAFFKWIIGDRLGREILGVCGTFLFFFGFLKKHSDKEGPLLHLLALASFLYLVVVATGNVQHDYYQLLISPVLAIFLARGFILLMRGVPGFLPRLFTIPMATLFLFLTFYLTKNEVLGLYQINNGVIIEAGREADKVLPQDAVVIAPYNGDTSFLYQINRPGWAFLLYPIEGMIEHFHTTHFVSVNFDDATNNIIKKYKVVERTSKFVIVDLREPARKLP